jgi:hypothetical protein
MADSKEETQVGSENPSGITTLVVLNPGGKTTREVRKDSKGRFLKKEKPPIPASEFVKAERKALMRTRKDKENLTEHMVAFMNLLRIAQDPSTDPRSKMAAVKAWEAIRLYATGQPAPSEEALKNSKLQQVKVIVVEAPQLMNPEVKDSEEAKIKTKPSFIDAEVVQQN